MPKVYCVIDCYRNGRFVSFFDTNSDQEFIEHIYRVFPDQYGFLMRDLYRISDSDFDCGVNYSEFEVGVYTYKASRRFDYELPF